MHIARNQLLGVRIGTRTLSELVAASESAIAARSDCFTFACANPHSLVVARGDAEFSEALDRASAIVADGFGCKLAATLTGVDVGPRVTGFDYFESMMASLNRISGRAFFFGSRVEVLAAIVARVARDYPNVAVETLSPPFGEWSHGENATMLESVRRFAPDVLWVGLTAPKQEKWVAANESALGVSVVASIGAVFDYYAGFTHRAPRWVQRLGLEWLYRLAREPRRLWRRTVISAPQFLWMVLRGTAPRVRPGRS
jgi:N-acetylglucosaminyldiphosphoundecaprenol N-acetyl-beta-D-mannosaminyltransferase